MIVGGIILTIAVFVVLIGTKQNEAIVLYYDAVDVTPEMVEKGEKPEVGETPSSDMGDQPAAVEEQPKRVSVTVGGSAVNAGTKKSKPAAEESLDDIRAAAAAHDPVDTQKLAQSTYSMLKGKKL